MGLFKHASIYRPTLHRSQCWFGYLVANTFCNVNFSMMANLGVNSFAYGFLGANSICLKTEPNIQILKLQQSF